MLRSKYIIKKVWFRLESKTNIFFYLFDFSTKKKISIIKANLNAKYSYFTIKSCLFADVAFIEEKENFFHTKIIVNNGGDYKTTWIYVA